MSIVLKVSSGGVPAGSYLAVFTGLEPTNNEFGEGLRWTFEVLTGPHKGSRTFRTTTPGPTLKNACGKLLSGLTGKPLMAGDEFKPEDYVGKTYMVVVGNTDTGSTRIESVTQPPVG